MSAEPTYLVFETGGTKLVAGLAGKDGMLHTTTSLRRDPSDRASYSLASLVTEADEKFFDWVESGAPEVDGLRAIGFGFGGTVRRSTNSLHVCLHEDGWEEVDPAPYLEDRYKVPVFVENDCKLAALAEAHCGAGSGAGSVFYVTLGTGVGGGYVRDGKIQAFGDVGEAEIGHMVVDSTGLECSCGNVGCIEATCSGPGLAKSFRLQAEHMPDVWESCAMFDEAGPDAVGSVEIIRAWEGGDQFADATMHFALNRLAIALGSVVNLLAPEVIVVGGGVGTSSPLIVEFLRELTPDYVVPYFRDSYKIAPSQLGESVVAQGAAILAHQSIE